MNHETEAERRLRIERTILNSLTIWGINDSLNEAQVYESARALRAARSEGRYFDAEYILGDLEVISWTPSNKPTYWALRGTLREVPRGGVVSIKNADGSYYELPAEEGMRVSICICEVAQQNEGRVLLFHRSLSGHTQANAWKLLPTEWRRGYLTTILNNPELYYNGEVKVTISPNRNKKGFDEYGRPIPNTVSYFHNLQGIATTWDFVGDNFEPKFNGRPASWGVLKGVPDAFPVDLEQRVTQMEEGELLEELLNDAPPPAMPIQPQQLPPPAMPAQQPQQQARTLTPPPPPAMPTPPVQQQTRSLLPPPPPPVQQQASRPLPPPPPLMPR